MSKNKRREIAFTAERIRSIVPESNRIFIYDIKTSGLRIQVTPAGSKTFQYYVWVKNHGPVRISIGKFPGVTVKAARIRATSIAGEISIHGRAVVDDLRAERDEQTFGVLFESWFADQATMGRRDLVNVRSRYVNHIQPTLGSKRISTLTEGYLQQWFLRLPRQRKAQGRGTISHSTSNRCMELVAAVLGAKTKNNTAASIKHFPEVSRERYLSGDELGKLFDALDQPETSPDLKDIVMTALLTGARKMNVLSMRWTDLDLANMIWIIPANKSKNNQSMGIPLISEAVDILERRKRDMNSVFVFGSTRSKNGHISDVKKSFRSLLKRAGIIDFRFHDLRRTLGSWQAQIGSSDIIIGKSLGHSSPQSTRVYARIRDSNPIRNSMSDAVSAMVEASKSNKIVNMNGGK